MGKRSISYHDELIRSLKDSNERAEYINAALEEGDLKLLLKALRNVAEATGGMTKLSAKTRLARVSLYRMLSDQGNPELASLEKILRYFGLKLSVQPERAHPSSQR